MAPPPEKMDAMFSIVVAADLNRGIGSKGQLPWRLKGDMKHFRDITTGDGKNVVIMGRKTWESIPDKFRPLPNRSNVVLTRNTNYKVPDGVFVAQSLEEALTVKGKKTFVIGGGEIYAEAMQNDQCKEMFLTLVDGMYACDAFLAPYDELFERAESLGVFSENGVSYRVERWTRID
jgi:dihydrofolate reductase